MAPIWLASFLALSYCITLKCPTRYYSLSACGWAREVTSVGEYDMGSADFLLVLAEKVLAHDC